MPPIPLHDHAAMSSLRSRVASVLCVAALAVSVAWADDNWPRFRGAEGGVAADDPRLPDAWGPSQNIVWQIDVPGWSWSSPVVWGDHVFVTTAVNTAEADKADGRSRRTSPASSGGPMTFKDIAAPSAPHRWVLYDIDFKTGRIRWEREVTKAVPAQLEAPEKQLCLGDASDRRRASVCVIRPSRLVRIPSRMESRCGRSHCAPFEMLRGFGTAKSPVVDDERVYIVNDNEEQSFIAAYDKRTGAESWRVNRKETSNWTTPYVWKNERRTGIVTAGTGGVQSFGVDGKLLWQLTGMSTFAVPSPFSAGGLLYVTSGYTANPRRRAYAIRPGATGDISLKPNETSNEYIVWSHPTLGPFHPSTMVYRGCYYTLHDRGFLTCNDPKSGERDLSPAAHRNRRDRLHGVPIGI